MKGQGDAQSPNSTVCPAQRRLSHRHQDAGCMWLVVIAYYKDRCARASRGKSDGCSRSPAACLSMRPRLAPAQWLARTAFPWQDRHPKGRDSAAGHSCRRPPHAPQPRRLHYNGRGLAARFGIAENFPACGGDSNAASRPYCSLWVRQQWVASPNPPPSNLPILSGAGWDIPMAGCSNPERWPSTGRTGCTSQT